MQQLLNAQQNQNQNQHQNQNQTRIISELYKVKNVDPLNEEFIKSRDDTIEHLLAINSYVNANIITHPKILHTNIIKTVPEQSRREYFKKVPTTQQNI